MSDTTRPQADKRPPDVLRAAGPVIAEPFKDVRGAQVILTGDAQMAARGGFHGEIAGNTMARDAAIADGHTTSGMMPSEVKPPAVAQDLAMGVDSASPGAGLTVAEAEVALAAAKEREKRDHDASSGVKAAVERNEARRAAPARA